MDSLAGDRETSETHGGMCRYVGMQEVMCVYMRIGIPEAIFTNMQEAVDKRYVRKPGKRQEMIRDLEQMGASNSRDDKKIEKVIIPLVKRWPEYCSE